MRACGRGLGTANCWRRLADKGPSLQRQNPVVSDEEGIHSSTLVRSADRLKCNRRWYFQASEIGMGGVRSRGISFRVPSTDDVAGRLARPKGPIMNGNGFSNALSRRELMVGAAAVAAFSLVESGCPTNENGNGDAGPIYGSALSPATFVAGSQGAWKIERVVAVSGEVLAAADWLDVQERIVASPGGTWSLRGVAGQARYAERKETVVLDAESLRLGRPDATRAALIPIKKSSQWWAMPQDERRVIFEERSHHISDSAKYVPFIARRLYQSRDLGEPFDFLTWFEFAPEHAGAFDELLAMLRAREEWKFVEHEVEVRLVRS